MNAKANAGIGDHLAKAFKSGLEVAGGLNSTGPSSALSTKAEVNYRQCDDNVPNNSEQCCEACKHFDGKSACDIVSGKISPVYVCDKFEAAAVDPNAVTNG